MTSRNDSQGLWKRYVSRRAALRAGILGAAIPGILYVAKSAASADAADGDIYIPGAPNFLELGYGWPGKDANAGKISYRKWSDGLDIVGAGTTSGHRKVKIWDDLYVPGLLNLRAYPADPAVAPTWTAFLYAKSVNGQTTKPFWKDATGTAQPLVSRSATLVVAASNASPRSKLGADYVCDGTADEVEINAAIAALPAGGGKVVLSEGTFTLAARINFPAIDNIVLEGAGREATTITAVNASAIDSTMVRISGRSNCSVRHLTIDGNKANQAILLCGLYLENCNNCDVEDVSIIDTTHIGLYIDSTSSASPNLVRRVIITNAGNLAVIPGGSAGFQLDNDVVGSVIGDLTVISSSGHGIVLGNCDYTKLIRPRAISNAKRGISSTAKYLEIMHPYAASNGYVGMQLLGYEGVGGIRIIGGVTELNGTAAVFAEGSGLIITAAPHSEIIGLIARYNAIDDGPNENGGIGIENCGFCKVIGCTAEYNGGPGIFLYMASDCRFIGCTARNNGQYASAGQPFGIVLGTDGIVPSSRNIFAHIRSYDDQTPKTQTHGYSIRPGAASSNNRVLDSDLSGNLTADYDDSSGGTGNEARGIGALADHGNAGAIPVYASGSVALVTGAGLGTRTLADPTFVGQEVYLYFDTDGGGDCQVTAANDITQVAGENVMTFSDAGEHILLRAINMGAALRWRVIVKEGVVLS